MKFSKLRLIERQVEEEGKQWKRKRMEELIKQLAPQEGEVSPLGQKRLTKKRATTLRFLTLSGRIEVETISGYDAQTNAWICPLRETLELAPGESEIATPELVERLCYTATQTMSFVGAEQVARKWGVDVSDAAIHRYVQKAGAGAEQSKVEQTERALNPATRLQVVADAARRVAREDFSLVIMMDGWMMRERGLEWGLKPPDKVADRVEWREMKSGILFRVQDIAQTQTGRGLLLQKYFESYRGDPDELGRRMFALALRNGLYQARHVFVVGDGALWIWSVAAERFPDAVEQLDFYHVSEHLWEVAHALHEDPEQARKWIEPLLHKLRHKGEAGILKTLDNLSGLLAQLATEKKEIVEGGRTYLHKNRHRLSYTRNHSKGCPLGSGAMESTCAQFQSRFKRTGQFWTRKGAAMLMALDLLRRNQEWDQYWSDVG